ncbi:MAG: FMN-binding negative transcriptional regulator [Acidimicrobiales bacterium]
MYNPSHFRESDPVVLRDTVRRLGAGELITYGSGGLEASLLPLLMSDTADRVTGHLALANPQWRHADLDVPAMVTWRGPDAYVSPSYYPSKRVHGKVVPTWNYVTVQARGTLVLHEDEGWKRALVGSLTAWHEAGFPSPWSVDDAPSDYVDGLLASIVGIEVRITWLEGKWKLSQNRPESDIAGVIAGLRGHDPASNEARVAEVMVRSVAASTE